MGKQARDLSRKQRQTGQAARQRAARRNRVIAAAGGFVIAGLLIAIVISLVNAAGKGSTADTDKPLVTPATATAQGALLVGRPDAPVRVEIFLDYMCPFCGRFERANTAELARLAADGTARLELYPLSFLDHASSGSRYSTRAANAIATVADRSPDRLLAFNAALFTRQPDEGSSGLSDAEIADLAVGAGVPQEVTALFGAATYEPWIAKITDAAFKGGISGTPTVKINGMPFKGDLYTTGPLTEAVTAAKG